MYRTTYPQGALRQEDRCFGLCERTSLSVAARSVVIGASKESLTGLCMRPIMLPGKAIPAVL
jgi:hypothetical protein